MDDHPFFQLEPAGEGRFRAPREAPGTGTGIVFGGELLGHTILAAAAAHPSKQVRSVQTIFARAARPDRGTELVVLPVHEGRSFASAQIAVVQGDRICAQSLVLLHAPDAALIEHDAAMPAVDGPDDAAPAGPSPLVFSGGELRIVGGVDVNDPAEAGPPELFCWLRHDDAPTALAARQAMLAFATDGFLIGTAMRPHEGIGQRDAHRTISTGVVGHAISFHAAPDPRAWWLLAHESPQAGDGRAYGRAQIFAQGGRLLASVSQDAMIRAMPEGGRV